MNATWDELDPYIETFERARGSEPIADLRAFAPPPSHARHLDVLRELVCIDLEFGWAEGRPKPLSDYRKAFPSLFANPAHAREIAFEEYRLRRQSGERPNLGYYRNLGIDVTGWPTMQAIVPVSYDAQSDLGHDSNQPAVSATQFAQTTPAGRANDPRLAGSGPSNDGAAPVEIPDGSTLRQISPRATDNAVSFIDVPKQLHRRLRYFSLSCTMILAYFSLLVLLNPTQKVAFSLESWFPIATHWIAFLLSSILTLLLWIRSSPSLRWLRSMELAVFGVVTAQMSASLFSDLFLDHELIAPFTEGSHSLFHYASSWSLPFFALIICYGTLIPTTSRRCVKVVTAMAAVPLAISLAGGLSEGIPFRSFVESYLVQMAVWLTAAIAIAVYGTAKLEVLRREIVRARRLGQYHLKDRLGAGGMGEVYLAEHVLLRRPCAVKLIRSELARDPEAQRRFEHEVQVTATLTHPNTVQVYDYGHTEDGTFYYVMEHLPGRNLEQVVRNEGPLEQSRAVGILQQICGALSEAHSAGLVHRDLKPNNVILCERGGVADVAKLFDFGLAVSHDAGRQANVHSGDGVVAGSPSFMSPEQAAGHDDLDPRTDVYSLGALAYFLVTGRPPFVGDSAMQILTAHLHKPVEPPSRWRPDLSPALESVILRCLEKLPANRFQNMADVAGALRFVV